MIDSPEIWFTCPELTYYDLTVEVKDLNSIEKISDRISDVISGGESESTAHLVLGELNHFKQKQLSSNYVSIESSDVDVFDFSIENKGKLIENPKKGEVVFVFFYYHDHADYVLTKNENFKNTCFEVKSFKNEAVMTELDYSGFELTANDASGGGELRLEIICSDGRSFEGTVADKEDLIEEFHNYLIEKEEKKPQEGDITKKENGVLVSVQIFIQSELEDWVDEENDTSFKDGSYTQEAKDFAIGRIKSFVGDLKEKVEGLIGERILLNIGGKEDLHELDERANTIEVELGDYEEYRIYILLINEISGDDLNNLFLSMDGYGFNTMFPDNGKLIVQSYDYGEYDTGYYQSSDETKKHYIHGHIKEDGSWAVNEGAFISNDIISHFEEKIKKYNKAVKMLLK